MTAPNEISPAQLLRLVGTPDAPAIVDVCIAADVADLPARIPGALRHSHTDLDSLPARLAGRRAVVVCQKGHKLSQAVAAWLRSMGHPAESLAGGMLAWRDTPDAPMIPDAAQPAGPLWITRQRPRIDRIACPWLIRRFIDPQARFLFVAASEVLPAADRIGATAFDVPGAPFTHQGAHCSFDALLAGFALSTLPLMRMAQVIRAADCGRPQDDPAASGLLALSVGFARMYRDDNAQVEAMLPLYDALYRWARDGNDETHDTRFAATDGARDA